MAIAIGSYDTQNFSFLIVGRDEDHVRELMQEAWQRHCEQTGADRTYFNAEDVNVTFVRQDYFVLRDGSFMLGQNVRRGNKTAVREKRRA